MPYETTRGIPGDSGFLEQPTIVKKDRTECAVLFAGFKSRAVQRRFFGCANSLSRVRVPNAMRGTDSSKIVRH